MPEKFFAKSPSSTTTNPEKGEAAPLSLEIESSESENRSTATTPQFSIGTVAPKEHAQRLQTLFITPLLKDNHQEIYQEVTSILLFYSVQEVNTLFSEYKALTASNLHDDVLLFFVKCQALDIVVPVFPSSVTQNQRFTKGISTFTLSFILAESLDLYLDNLNLPLFVSLIGALSIAFFAEWVFQPYVKGKLK